MLLKRERSFYEKYVKRILDIICSILAITFLGWLYIVIVIMVRVKLGKPVIFKQIRPGMIDPGTGKECLFYMYKFRTMTDKRDSEGMLLPDEERLTSFGKVLRATSLDELPEVFNILKGDMSVIGPRPQLVRDMVFMSEEQRMRHTAKPGLSGLAQVMGRNAITWEEKFCWDLKYINDVSLWNDIKIIWMTFKKVVVRRNIFESNEEVDIADDYGDELLKYGLVEKSEYDVLQVLADNIIKEYNRTGV